MRRCLRIVFGIVPLMMMFAMPVLYGQQASEAPKAEQDRVTKEQMQALRQKLQEFRTQNSEQRQELRNRFKQLREMDRQERAKLRESLAEYRRLTRQQQQQLRENLQRFRSMPLARQQQLRNIYRRFEQMSPDQRTRLLENLQKWEQLTPEERSRLRSHSDGHELNATPSGLTTNAILTQGWLQKTQPTLGFETQPFQGNDWPAKLRTMGSPYLMNHSHKLTIN